MRAQSTLFLPSTGFRWCFIICRLAAWRRLRRRRRWRSQSGRLSPGAPRGSERPEEALRKAVFDGGRSLGYAITLRRSEANQLGMVAGRRSFTMMYCATSLPLTR